MMLLVTQSLTIFFYPNAWKDHKAAKSQKNPNTLSTTKKKKKQTLRRNIPLREYGHTQASSKSSNKISKNS